VKVSIDTNVLLRIILKDHEGQLRSALQTLRQAEIVFLPTAALCEAAWVLGRSYGLSREEIAAGLRVLLEIDNTACEEGAVDMGLAMLARGGDFADGVVAQQGLDHEAEIFITFDRRAISRLTALGVEARLPGGSDQ